MHSVGPLPEDDTVIEVRYSGLVNDAERVQVLLESLGWVRGPGPRVLADFSAATMLGDDPQARLDYMAIVNKLPDLRDGKLALVAARHLPATDHLQVLATTRGFRYRNFETRALAVAWLLQG